MKDKSLIVLCVRCGNQLGDDDDCECQRAGTRLLTERRERSRLIEMASTAAILSKARGPITATSFRRALEDVSAAARETN